MMSEYHRNTALNIQPNSLGGKYSYVNNNTNMEQSNLLEKYIIKVMKNIL